MPTYRTVVRPEWIDYNEHLRDAFYFLIFSYATDALMERIGLDEIGRASTGHTLFTLEAHINYLAQATLGDPLEVRTRFIDRDRKRLHIEHSLHHGAGGQLLAVSEQMLMNINFHTSKACGFAASVEQRLDALVPEHSGATHPGYCGRMIAIRR